MKLGIMQPYFFPYIGYYQLINVVDKFIIYDNVKYTKKGWFNRNRLIFGDKVEYFSISLKKDSDFLTVSEREISDVFFSKDMPKILRKIKHYYHKAPFFDFVFPLLEEVFHFKERNLFRYIFNSIIKVTEYLEIQTEIIISSKIPIDHMYKNKYKIFEFCKYFNCDNYINPIGGINLYDKEEFRKNGIKLNFLKTSNIYYKRFNDIFEPNLSIIDVMMFNSKNEIKELLNCFELL